MGKTTKIFFYSLFIVTFVWVSAQLFFHEGVEKILERSSGLIFGHEDQLQTMNELKVVYPTELTTLEPTVIEPMTRQRLVNIYEPLVKTDRDLNTRPALALSWGLIDDLVWEFHLRRDVVFHDGSSFNVQDAVASIQRAIKYPQSDLKGLLTSVEKLEVIDDFTFRVHTTKPDPLLLQRLSLILIIPAEYELKELSKPIGTASYKYDTLKGSDYLLLERFEDYWGEEAVFDNVVLFSRVNKSERVNMFLKGEADVLAFVPYDAVSAVIDSGFEVATIPTLEVQFLLLNTKSKLLDTVEERLAVKKSIDQAELTKVVGGDYAHRVSQFVSSGIFGFNPEIIYEDYALEAATEAVLASGLDNKTLKLHLPLGMDVLGEHVRTKLGQSGINVVVSYLELEDLLASMDQGKADIYFFGFKSDLGDAGDFLTSIVHSNGDFNVGNYSDLNVDYLVDAAMTELDPQKRRDILQQAMKIVVEEDVVGVPLFEYDTVYSFSDKLDMQPRIDGFIYFDELKFK